MAWRGTRWVVSVLLFASAASGARAAEVAAVVASFVDGGDPSSLRQAVDLARSGLRGGAGASPLLDALASGLEGDDRAVGSVLARHARPRRTADVLLTGYYEPTLRARRQAGGPFRYPIYRLPPDGSAGRRASRRDIDGGALAGRGLELFWLDDPIEAFFLHVQGSGRLDLGDGATARAGYAGNNGHAYHSIGTELLRRGAFASAEEVTAPAIKAWLRENPGEAASVLHSNPRYIFFREIDAPLDRGPPGSMNVALIPFRSVAADPAVAAPGSVGLLTAPMPDGSTLRRVVVAMDQGAAIRGASRLDLFLGAGPAAEQLAGVLRSRGRIVWLE